jgi:NADPH:quinone reductase-like Zn-dependent oxidoreductase
MSRILGHGPVRGTERGRGRSQEVTRCLPGDEVLSTAQGALPRAPSPSTPGAPESKLTPKQANLTFEQAAVVAVPGQIALQSLHDHGRVQRARRC